jgi:hypothetical protein
VRPDLGHHFGFGSGDREPAASWVPSDLSGLDAQKPVTPEAREMPAPPTRQSHAPDDEGKADGVRALQAAIKSTHAQILQHVGLGDRDIQRLDKAARGAHQHLNYAHEAHLAGKPVEYRNHMGFAHTHIDDMHDINSDAWGDESHTERLQEHIGRLY